MLGDQFFWNLILNFFFGTPCRTMFKNNSLIRFMHPYEVEENAGVPPDERGTAHPDPQTHPTVITALFFLFFFSTDQDSLSLSGKNSSLFPVFVQWIMILFHSQVAERSQLGCLKKPCRERPTKAPSPTLRRASLRPCRSNPARL